MYKMGISVFNGLKEYNIVSNIEYIKKAKELGYEMIFSSAHINEAETATNDLKACIDLANSLNMKLILDISKPAFEKINDISGLYALRLDYGFTDDDIVKLSQEAKCFIELNASTITNEKFENLIAKGLNLENIRVSFNYYPKLHTGHTIEFCKERIEYFHKHHLSVGAFLPSKNQFRPPMYQGLPTVEKHRKEDINLAIEELKAIDTDEIIFGDAYASDFELQMLTKHNNLDIALTLNVLGNLPDEVYDILKTSWIRRIDYNNELIRLTSKTNIKGLKPFNNFDRKKWSLTIDNELFLRYQGEVNIVINDLEKDERVNVIGELCMSDIVLDKIKQGKNVTFMLKR